MISSKNEAIQNSLAENLRRTEEFTQMGTS